jgi:hypothetical protein
MIVLGDVMELKKRQPSSSNLILKKLIREFDSTFPEKVSNPEANSVVWKTKDLSL